MRDIKISDNRGSFCVVDGGVLRECYLRVFIQAEYDAAQKS